MIIVDVMLSIPEVMQVTGWSRSIIRKKRIKGELRESYVMSEPLGKQRVPRLWLFDLPLRAQNKFEQDYLELRP